MPGLLGLLLPALIGGGATVAGQLIGGQGNDALSQQADQQSLAIQQFLKMIGQSQSQAEDLRGNQEDIFANIAQSGPFSFAGLPGLDQEAQSFLSSAADPFANAEGRGLQSTVPQAQFLRTLMQLSQQLGSVGSGSAPAQAANNSFNFQNALGSSIGSSIGGTLQSFQLQKFLEELLNQSSATSFAENVGFGGGT